MFDKPTSQAAKALDIKVTPAPATTSTPSSPFRGAGGQPATPQVASGRPPSPRIIWFSLLAISLVGLAGLSYYYKVAVYDWQARLRTANQSLAEAKNAFNTSQEAAGTYQSALALAGEQAKAFGQEAKLPSVLADLQKAFGDNGLQVTEVRVSNDQATNDWLLEKGLSSPFFAYKSTRSANVGLLLSGAGLEKLPAVIETLAGMNGVQIRDLLYSSESPTYTVNFALYYQAGSL